MVVKDFVEIVRALKNRYPEITLATDMIVGFCGETGQDFSASLNRIDQVRPNKVNITRYSSRPFTPFASEKDFPDWVKKERSCSMNVLAEKIYASVNVKYLEKQVPIVVKESIKKGSVMARSPNYLGIVINEDLPTGYTGYTILKKDRKYFFYRVEGCLIFRTLIKEGEGVPNWQPAFLNYSCRRIPVLHFYLNGRSSGRFIQTDITNERFYTLRMNTSYRILLLWLW